MSFEEGWEFRVLQMNKHCMFEIIENVVRPIPMVATITPNIQSKLIINDYSVKYNGRELND